MIRNYTAWYRSKDTEETIEYSLGALSLSQATLSATEMTPEGYVLTKLLYSPEWT